MGKGDKRRPRQVSDEVLADRWARTFGHSTGVVSNRRSDTDRVPVTGKVATDPDGTALAEGTA